MNRLCNFLDTKDKEKRIFEIVLNQYNENHKIILYTNNEERADYLDRFLWIYKQETFIPHKIFKYVEEESMENIAIVFEEINPINAKKIILDMPCSLNFAKQFYEIYDFVDSSTAKTLKESRERFKQYKNAGFSMNYEKDYKG